MKKTIAFLVLFPAFWWYSYAYLDHITPDLLDKSAHCVPNLPWWAFPTVCVNITYHVAFVFIWIGVFVNFMNSDD